MSFAPPIARDGFHYNGELYVEVGNLNRHKRASIPEITAILRPDLKKPKNAAAAAASFPPKDPVGHWYEAQLIHYGLPPSKDKARAKMRLLEALNGSKLVVPAEIAKLEADMKKEYAAAERKAKAQYKASIAGAGQSDATPNTKKRKQPEPATNSINVNINFGPYGSTQFPIMPSTTSYETAASHTEQAPKKKAKTTANSAPKNPGTGRKAASQDPTQKATPKKQTAKKPSTISSQPSHNFNDEDIASQTALAEMLSPKKKKAPATTKPTPAAKATTTKPTPKPKKEPSIKKEPDPSKPSFSTPTKSTPSIKPDPSIKPEPSPPPSYNPNAPPLGLLNGLYTLSTSLPSNPSSTLILTLERTSLWGSFSLGPFTGILYLPDRPWEPSERGLPCTWRGRERGAGAGAGAGEGEGMIWEGDVRRGEGEILFLGNGMVEGWVGGVRFWGRRRWDGGRAMKAPRSARSMRGEWEGYGGGD